VIDRLKRLEPALHRLLVFSLLYFTIAACTANVTNSFFLKWGFRDQHGVGSFDLISIIDGSAPKPYVYRRLIPASIDAWVNSLSEQTRQAAFRRISRSNALKSHYFPDVPSSLWTPRYALDFHLLYVLVLGAFALTLVLMRKIYLQLHPDDGPGALLSLVVFSFVYPLTFQSGGFFYDWFELLGIALTVYLYLARRPNLATVALLATSFNKETTFLLAFGLYFLNPGAESRTRRALRLGVQLLLCLASRALITAGYPSNPGASVELHLAENLRFWLNPLTYVRFDNQYALGVFTPNIENLLLAPLLIVWFRYGWRNADESVKRCVLALALLLAPLYLLFGFQDEVRAFSLLFVPCFALLSAGFGPLWQAITMRRRAAARSAAP